MRLRIANIFLRDYIRQKLFPKILILVPLSVVEYPLSDSKMKLAVVLLCSMSTLVLATETAVRGVRISTREEVTCTDADSGLKCSTCTEALVCSGGASKGTIKCEAPNSYCDAATNQCTNVQSADCTATAATFACPEEGFFPDPSNCQNYYYCDTAKVAEAWVCPTSYVYDALNNNCKWKYFAADCVTMKCVAGATNPFIVHTANPRFYAFCDATTLLPTMFKCPLNMQFNLSAYGCKFVCKAEGYFPGSTAQQYYHCAKSGLTWVVTVNECPANYEFSATTKNCVKV